MDWGIFAALLFMLVVGITLTVFSGKLADYASRYNVWVFGKFKFKSTPYWSESGLKGIYFAFGVGTILASVIGFVFLLIFGW